MKFDPNLNLEFNEGYAFTLVNKIQPLHSKVVNSPTRVFLARDCNTGAWDGEHVYFYAET